MTLVPTQGVTVTATQIPVTLGQAVVPTMTDMASLTTQATQAVVSESRYQDAQEALSGIRTPYPSQTPTKLLERQYKVAEFDVTPAFTNVQLPFPGVLFAQPVLSGAMQSFPFWKGDIKVHVKMQAVPQQRGALLVSWLPCTAKVVTNSIEASGNHATILNVSTSDTCTFVIPYLSPKAWLRNPPTTASDHSTLYITSLVPLGVPTGISAVVKMTVYASLENPLVAGFKHAAVADEAHSLQPTSKIMAKVSPFVKIFDDLATVIEPALDVLNLLDKPDMTTSKTHYVVNNGYQASMWLTDAEQPSIPLSLKERPYLANTVNLFPLGKSSDSFATLASNPMLCDRRDITAAGNRIEYAVTPCTPAYDGAVFKPDYLFHFTSYASYWRGSIRFFMHFCCDQFTSARFRVGITYSAWNANWADSGDVPSVVVDVHGSTYYAVTVPYLQEDYWQPVVIPFNLGSSYFPRLIIEALDTPVGATLPSAPKIEISLFRAAGPDFQLAEPGYHVAGPAFDKAQCSLEGAFSKTFASLVPDTMFATEVGMCMPELMDSPAQLGKRICDEALRATTLAGDTPESMPHHYLNLNSKVFIFWRGSRRLQTRNKSDTGSVRFTTGVGVANLVNPSVRMGADANMATITLPYYSPLPYRVSTTYPYTGAPFKASVTWFEQSAAQTALDYRYLAGDDLVQGHLVAPNYAVTSPS